MTINYRIRVHISNHFKHLFGYFFIIWASSSNKVQNQEFTKLEYCKKNTIYFSGIAKNRTETLGSHLVNVQYLLGNPFALITASMHLGIEAISLWHCAGVMEAQTSLMLAISSSWFLGMVSLMFLLTIPHRFSMGFRSGELAGQSSTGMAWSSNQDLVLLAVWEGARSCWKMKSASPYRSSTEGIRKSSKTF